MLKPSKKFIYFTIRFILVHVITYIFIGVVFSNFDNFADLFLTMDTIYDFRAAHSKVVKLAPAIQIIRGTFFAFILYPFYNKIIKSNFAWLKLFFLIWGFSLLGSAAPIPGSIEGLIYTEISLTEHLLRLVRTAIHIFVFSWFFVKWENRTERDYN